MDIEILDDSNLGFSVVLFPDAYHQMAPKKSFPVVPVCPNYAEGRATNNGKSNSALHKDPGHEARARWSSLAVLAKLSTWLCLPSTPERWLLLRGAFLIPSQKGGHFSNSQQCVMGQAVAPHEKCFKIEQLRVFQCLMPFSIGKKPPKSPWQKNLILVCGGKTHTHTKKHSRSWWWPQSISQNLQLLSCNLSFISGYT